MADSHIGTISSKMSTTLTIVAQIIMKPRERISSSLTKEED
uniref:DNA-binding protein HEXBP n=1 Tax=Arundo donax TaxID=35708 RepID=A0A0A9HHU2_ARUDO